jgi:hypothetical protein
VFCSELFDEASNSFDKASDLFDECSNTFDESSNLFDEASNSFDESSNLFDEASKSSDDFGTEPEFLMRIQLLQWMFGVVSAQLTLFVGHKTYNHAHTFIPSTYFIIECAIRYGAMHTCAWCRHGSVL